jgi:hypothetical protein
MRSLSGVKTRKVVPQERRTKMLDEWDWKSGVQGLCSSVSFPLCCDD